jgi:hypothetical protein
MRADRHDLPIVDSFIHFINITHKTIVTAFCGKYIDVITLGKFFIKFI